MDSNNDFLLKIISNFKLKMQEDHLANELYKWLLIKENQKYLTLNEVTFEQDMKAVKFENLVYQNMQVVERHLLKENAELYRKILIKLLDENHDLVERIHEFDKDVDGFYRSVGGKHAHHHDERTAATPLTFKYPEKYVFYMSSFYEPLCSLLDIPAEEKGRKYHHYLQLINEFVEKYIRNDDELTVGYRKIIENNKNMFQDQDFRLLAQNIFYTHFVQNRGYWRIGTTYGSSGISFWPAMKEKGVASVHYPQFQDLSEFEITSEASMKKLFQEKASELYKNKATLTKDSQQLYKFYKGMKINDVILAQEGQKVLGLGIIQGDYSYEPGGDGKFQHYRETDWTVVENEDLVNKEGLLTTVAKLDDPKLHLNVDEWLNGNYSSVPSIFFNLMSKYDTNELNNYFTILRKVLNYFNIRKGDQRVSFSTSGEQLNFIIGNRYCLNLRYKYPDRNFSAVLHRKDSEISEKFIDNTVTPYLNYYPFAELSDELFDEHLKAVKYELDRTMKSNFRNKNNPEFENFVFEIEAPELELRYPLNTIFYGPPGTGKTYRTVQRAAEIIEGRIIDNYDDALRIFNEELSKEESQRRIEFITFHQNYSYEDFIQGLRPRTDDASTLLFDKRDGIFKKIADRALMNLTKSLLTPEEISEEQRFDDALQKFSEELLSSEGDWRINDSAFIMEVEDDAFRYSGANWGRHSGGIRMKFSDLKEFYRRQVGSRREIKDLAGISGLAKQHATYYFLVYEQILQRLPDESEVTPAVGAQDYVIIIDEINRANISRVFGELITLIEKDKRSHGSIPMTVTLPSGDPFCVPSNLYIIGTMNTADKSIALLDIALRRRFDFEAMYPDPGIEGVHDADVLEKMNELIIKTKGYDFQIGHAYFMGEDDLVTCMNKRVIPLLLEYFMNSREEVEKILETADLALEANSWPLRISGRK